MRRMLLLAGLLLFMVLPSPALAGTCPALEGGVVDKDTYRLGELIDFYGTYHDFADPGTVTLVWERTTDGATREYTAANSPDGSWYLRLTLESQEDVGRWAVTVTVTQTDGLDTCTDTVTIRPPLAPPTTATALSGERGLPGSVVAPLVLAGIVGAAIARRRLEMRSGRG